MSASPSIPLKPVVRFREFPFGAVGDPSMRDFGTEHAWENEGKVVEYLRSGLILGVTMGADLPDFYDPPNRANPIIDGSPVGGTIEMTDGVWFWYAGLIYFVEKYHIRLPAEFIRHAARQGWRLNKGAIPPASYECSYFASPTNKEATVAARPR